MEEVDKSFAIFLFNTGVAVKKKCHERPLEFLKFFQVNKLYVAKFLPSGDCRWNKKPSNFQHTLGLSWPPITKTLSKTWE